MKILSEITRCLYLLERYSNVVNEQLLPLLDYASEMDVSKKHIGQMGYKHSLSVSRHQLMHHFLTLGHGQILAFDVLYDSGIFHCMAGKCTAIV